MKLCSYIVFAAASALSLLAAETAFPPRIEVIDEATLGRFTLDDRPSALVVIDESILAFDKSRDTMLEWLASYSHRKITFVNVEAMQSIRQERFDQVYCFGKGVSLASICEFKPSVWYFILPTITPPFPPKSARVGVILEKSRDRNTMNRVWQKWCDEGKIPWREVTSGKKLPLLHALGAVYDQVEQLRLRE